MNGNDRLELCENTWDLRWKSSCIKNKRELNLKIYLAINGYGMPVKFIVTDGTRADCKKTINLLKNLGAKLVFADRAYDTNEILSYIAKRNIKLIIAPKRNRLEQRDFKGFRVLKKRDNNLTINFIALDVSSRIISLLLSVAFIASIYFRCIFMYLSFF